MPTFYLSRDQVAGLAAYVAAMSPAERNTIYRMELEDTWYEADKAQQNTPSGTGCLIGLWTAANVRIRYIAVKYDGTVTNV